MDDINILKFYKIDEEYLDYLKGFDRQVPNNVEEGHTKPFCGIVLEINDFKYYAPISSFNKKQKTNMVIYDGKKAISSVRFCFMIPAYEDVLTYYDFSMDSDIRYRRLLEKEYRYCKEHFEDLINIAEKTYKIGANRNHPLAYTCCDFRLLEDKMLEYSNDYMEIEKDA